MAGLWIANQKFFLLSLMLITQKGEQIHHQSTLTGDVS